MFTVNELIGAAGAVTVRGRAGRPVKGISIDSRKVARGEAFLAIKGENFDGHDFLAAAASRGASCLIKEAGKGKFPAGTDCVCLEVKDSVKALGDIANFHRRRFSIPVVAVTGSNGKTTTKEMLSWILGREFPVLKTEGTRNNNIGLPLTLLGLKPCHRAAVVELGTNHFGEISNLAGICLPNIAVITNIGPSHLEYFGGVDGVLKEKYSLVQNLSAPGIAILNADDRFLRGKIKCRGAGAFVLGFGTRHNSDFDLSWARRVKEGIEFSVNGKKKMFLRTIGAHNIYNAMAAAAAARLFGVSYEDIASAFGEFEFPAGRLKIRKFDSAHFIDDTYNSSPASLKQALFALEDFPANGRKIVIMGDMMELGAEKEDFHFRAGKQIARVCDKLIAVGKLSGLAAEAARKSGFATEDIYSCSSSSQAREILFSRIVPDKDDVVLVKGSRAMKMEKIFEER